jgi:hypothetical protein
VTTIPAHWLTPRLPWAGPVPGHRQPSEPPRARQPDAVRLGDRTRATVCELRKCPTPAASFDCVLSLQAGGQGFESP